MAGTGHWPSYNWRAGPAQDRQVTSWDWLTGSSYFAGVQATTATTGLLCGHQVIVSLTAGLACRHATLPGHRATRRENISVLTLPASQSSLTASPCWASFPDVPVNGDLVHRVEVLRAGATKTRSTHRAQSTKPLADKSRFVVCGERGRGGILSAVFTFALLLSTPPVSLPSVLFVRVCYVSV